MSFDGLLLHTLTVRRMADTGAKDDYGQPVSLPTTVAAVPGLIQPRSAREVALTSQAGPAIGSHVGYLRPLAGLGTDCWIEDDRYPGVRFDVLSMPDAAGQGHHLELALQAVT